MIKIKLPSINEQKAIIKILDDSQKQINELKNKDKEFRNIKK
jgi:restriction endonuclease S subunit